MSSYEVWLVIATGGRWTSRELADHFDRDPKDGISIALTQLTRSGAIKRYDTHPLSYGVTADCNIPLRVTLGDLLKAVGAPQ